MRAWRRIARRCFFGMRRQMSQAVRARPTGPARRRLLKRATERSLALRAVVLGAPAAFVPLPVTIVVLLLLVLVILLLMALVGVVALTGAVAVVALAVILAVLVALAGGALRLVAVVVAVPYRREDPALFEAALGGERRERIEPAGATTSPPRRGAEPPREPPAPPPAGPPQTPPDDSGGPTPNADS